MKFLGIYKLLLQIYTQVCAQIARPINQLVSGENASKKRALVEWTKECQVAFEHLRHLCSQTPILAYANYQKPFKLHTDASQLWFGMWYCIKSKMITQNMS